MMGRFLPCPRCKRHLRISESACPFCRARLPADFGPAPDVVAAATGPFARAAILFMGAATSACGGAVSGEPVPAPFYGPAVIDAGTNQDSSEPMPAVIDAGTSEDSGEPVPVVFYGPGVVDVLDATAEDSGGDSSADADSEEPVPLPFYGPAIVDPRGAK